MFRFTPTSYYIKVENSAKTLDSYEKSQCQDVKNVLFSFLGPLVRDPQSFQLFDRDPHSFQLFDPGPQKIIADQQPS